MVTLVVCEWEPATKVPSPPTTAREKIRRTKFRLHNTRSTIDELLQNLKSLIGDLDLYWIEVYDTESAKYTPIVASESKQIDESALKFRWGKIWRVRATPRNDSQSALLALPGRTVTKRDDYPVGDGFIRIKEKHNPQNNSTYSTVWDVLLAEYLKAYPVVVRGKTVLELGSGVGLVGLTAACLGAKYVQLTDLPEAVGLLWENTETNRPLWRSVGCDKVTCSTLDWFNPDPLPFPYSRDSYGSLRGCWDVLLVADCVWTLDLVEPLVNTLRALIDQTMKTAGPEHKLELFISYRRRGQHAHDAFWTAISLIFDVEELSTASMATTVSPNPKLLLRRCTPKLQNYDK